VGLDVSTAKGVEVFVYVTRGAGVEGGLVPFVRRGKRYSKVHKFVYNFVYKGGDELSYKCKGS
jgi:hypothetical protein